MKAPRFMTEYASYQKRRFKEILRNDSDLERAVEIIDKAVRLSERGKITIQEAMDIIGYPLSYAVGNDKNI